MTIADLTTDSTFNSLLDCWERDKHCPFALVDFLLDHDMCKEAEAARWAVEQPVRDTGGYGRKTRRVFPWGTDCYWWFYSSTLDYCNCVPVSWWDRFTGTRFSHVSPSYKTIKEALVDFLTNFVEKRNDSQTVTRTVSSTAAQFDGSG